MEDLTAKDCLMLAAAAFFVVLAIGGCQMIDDHHARYQKETEKMFPEKP